MRRAIRAFAWASLAFGLALFAFTVYGHTHRPDIETQRKAWHDGESAYSYAPRGYDSFDPALYEAIRSVDDAVEYVRKRAGDGSETDKLRATFDLTRRRFMHFMYPHHTWVTNPYLAAAEAIFPAKPFNSMQNPEALFRHSAVGACGDVANAFIAVYRALGGEARFAMLEGHHIAEAKADGKVYLVDPDLEVLAPVGVARFCEDEALVEQYYGPRPGVDIEHTKRVFDCRPTFFGYEGPTASSPRIQQVQFFIDYAKFAIPLVFVFLGLLLLALTPCRSRIALPESGTSCASALSDVSEDTR